MFIGGTEAATEIKDGIIIFQWQMSQQVIQFTEAIPDIRRVGFIGFLILEHGEGLRMLFPRRAAEIIAAAYARTFLKKSRNAQSGAVTSKLRLLLIYLR